MKQRPYDPILDGDVYLRPLPRFLYPDVTVSVVEGSGEDLQPGIQHDPDGQPVAYVIAYVIAPAPPRRTRDAALPKAGSFA